MLIDQRRVICFLYTFSNLDVNSLWRVHNLFDSNNALPFLAETEKTTGPIFLFLLSKKLFSVVSNFRWVNLYRVIS